MVSLERRRMVAALVALLPLFACRETAPFTHSGLHADDRLEWRLTTNIPELVVVCPFGIGRVALARSNTAVRELIVELHLDGLENFTVENSGTHYRIEVTSEQRVVAEPLADNPITVLAGPSTAGDGPWRLRIDLRGSFLHSDTIVLSWVDFYR